MFAGNPREIKPRPEPPRLDLARGIGHAGYLELQWQAVEGAAGYLVWLSDDWRVWRRDDARKVVGNLLFYRSDTGAFMTATLDGNGVFAQKLSGTFDPQWTSIAGTLAGGVLFYKAASGQLVAAKLDGNGSFSNWQAPASIAIGYTAIASARELGLVFYNAASGAVRTAVLDDGNRLTFKSNTSWSTGFTQIVGHPTARCFCTAVATGSRARRR